MERDGMQEEKPQQEQKVEAVVFLPYSLTASLRLLTVYG